MVNARTVPVVIPPHFHILGMKVTPLTVHELHGFIGRTIDAGERHLVLNVNVHCMNLAYGKPWLKEFLNSAPVVFCDGAGVMWAAKLQGRSIPERITYADWMWQLAAFCEAKGHSLYFLGARPGVAEKAAFNLKARFPGLAIKGCRDGFFDENGPDNEKAIADINAAKADILVMGLGMPKQEEWLKRNWSRINPAVALTGGACFDFISGGVPRCPRFMADHSMEWLYRLYVEPKRMFRRYVLGNPVFMARVLMERVLGPRRPGSKEAGA